ncbi:MAG: helix-turn-helix domain-containing protein [Bacilli bacterium]|nr:helix-turn-helix domain-containing protein [Bacilli bacterium]
MNNKFSENLKKIRKEHNLSQEQLADELGVSRQAVSKWESGVAYPEMDKIIAICTKFDLNIDDLLHRDIKEVKGEEASKKKINSLIDDFLKFITDTTNLFINMNFKSKVKCIFEQLIIMFVLYIISRFVISIFGTLFISVLGFLPNKPLSIISNIIKSIIAIFCMITSIIIIIHIFKTRYLDYYKEIIKEDNIKEKDNKDSKINLNNNEDRIIIRDPKHSEYRFINGLFKIIIIIIKLFLLWISIFIAFGLVFLFIMFILSFLAIKTGIFFIGLLASILSSATIAIIIILLILNFVFNRKNDKKKMIWGFIISLIVFGIGCGLIFIGSLDFNIVEEKAIQKIETKEHEMNDSLVISTGNGLDINYVESNINNVKIEYSINKYCSVDEHISSDNKYITAWGVCKNPLKVMKKSLKGINDKKIILISSDIEKVTVYANRNNIDKLKTNIDNYNKNKESYNDRIDYYENRIDELEEEKDILEDKIDELEEKLNDN